LPSGFGTNYIPKIHWDNRLLFPIGVAWIHLFVFFSFLGKKFNWSKTHWLFDLNCRTRNLFGFPIIQALYGAGMTVYWLISPDFCCAFDLVFWWRLATRGEQNGGQILKKFLFFRHLLLILACLLNVFGFDFDWIQFILQKVGSGVTPLA
jgi:hypothetical protein